LENINQRPSRFDQQLKTFQTLLAAYPGEVPLARFLPGFFRENKQMGSNDRRIASRLIYNYFRIGKALSESSPSDRLFVAEFLCQASPTPFLEHFHQKLNASISASVDEKLEILSDLKLGFELSDVFPFAGHLSQGIDQNAFLKSFFVQPDLFIRIHPNKESGVLAVLDSAAVPYKKESFDCLRLPNGTKLDQIFPEEKFFEIQDISSQQTGAYFQPKQYDYWWDCCAASGGKSLLLFHQQPQIKLVVSDMRETILANLNERFQLAGLKKYQKKVLDLTQNPEPYIHDFHFDGIIVDAPCSGSGTWGRTPEMISQFREAKIGSFQRLQRSILRNVVKYLKPEKPLVYITCSVFTEENEENVLFLQQEFNLKLEKQEVLRGYDKKADTMFVARLLKES